MCGISGIINFDQISIKESILKKMTDLLSYRGPDDEGIYIKDNVGLGHRRLSIIDLAGGKQPFVSESENLVLTYNGEVYNYKEIRKELKGENFVTDSDTEVILKAYRKWGISCLEKFRGMFAFAIFDKRKRMIYLVRDRVGIKPIYYYRNKSELYFCSELNPLLKTIKGKFKISQKSLYEYLRYGYVSKDRVIFQDFHKVPPGHFMEIDLNKKSVSVHKYWDLVKFESRAIAEKEALQELDNHLQNIIKLYTRSDVKFGSFLSGGVDSGLITGYMGSYLKKPVNSFSIGYTKSSVSELKTAAEAASFLRTNHFEKVVEPNLNLDFFKKILTHFGEPFADSSAIPTYFVSKISSKHVKMVLSGDGGDELFGGYKNYPIVLRELNSILLSRVYQPCFNLLANFFTGKLGDRFCYHGLLPWEKHNYRMSQFLNEEIRQLMNNADDWIEHFATEYNTKDSLWGYQYRDFKNYMVDDVLTKVDRMSMANSIEVRVPLLDHKLVEFAFALKTNLKLRKKNFLKYETKYLLRKKLLSFLPKRHVHGKKRGFAIPLVKWVQKDFYTLIKSEVLKKENPIFEFLDKDFVEDLILDKFNRSPIYATKVWNIFILSLWFNLYQKEICF